MHLEDSKDDLGCAELYRFLHYGLELVALRVCHKEGDVYGRLGLAGGGGDDGCDALVVTYTCELDEILGAVLVAYGELVAYRHTERARDVERVLVRDGYSVVGYVVFGNKKSSHKNSVRYTPVV